MSPAQVNLVIEIQTITAATQADVALEVILPIILGVAVLVLCCAVFIWRHFGHHITPPIAMHHVLDEDEEDVEGLAEPSAATTPTFASKERAKQAGGLHGKAAAAQGVVVMQPVARPMKFSASNNARRAAKVGEEAEAILERNTREENEGRDGVFNLQSPSRRDMGDIAGKTPGKVFKQTTSVLAPLAPRAPRSPPPRPPSPYPSET